MRTIEYDTRALGGHPPESVRQILWDNPRSGAQSQPSGLVKDVFSRAGYSIDWLGIQRSPFYYTSREYSILYNLQTKLTAVEWALEGTLDGRPILDLGCGARKDTAETSGLHARTRIKLHEPWFARILHRLGARVVGVDVGDLSGEEFEAHNLDLLDPDALNSFPDQSFDLVHSSALYTSPELQRRVSGHGYDGSLEAARALVAVLRPQISRLVKPNGCYLFRESFDYLTVDRSGYEIGISPLSVFDPRIILENQLEVETREGQLKLGI